MRECWGAGSELWLRLLKHMELPRCRAQTGAGCSSVAGANARCRVLTRPHPCVLCTGCAAVTAGARRVCRRGVRSERRRLRGHAAAAGQSPAVDLWHGLPDRWAAGAALGGGDRASSWSTTAQALLMPPPTSTSLPPLLCPAAPRRRRLGGHLWLRRRRHVDLALRFGDRGPAGVLWPGQVCVCE